MHSSIIMLIIMPEKNLPPTCETGVHNGESPGNKEIHNTGIFIPALFSIETLISNCA